MARFSAGWRLKALKGVEACPVIAELMRCTPSGVGRTSAKRASASLRRGRADQRRVCFRRNRYARPNIPKPIKGREPGSGMLTSLKKPLLPSQPMWQPSQSPLSIRMWPFSMYIVVSKFKRVTLKSFMRLPVIEKLTLKTESPPVSVSPSPEMGFTYAPWLKPLVKNSNRRIGLAGAEKSHGRCSQLTVSA